MWLACVFFFLNVYLKLCFGVWRFFPVGVFEHHYQVDKGIFLANGQSLGLTYFGPGSPSWSADSPCYLNTHDSLLTIRCDNVSERVLGINLASCPSCNAQDDQGLTVRFIQNPFCFSWKVEQSVEDQLIQLTIYITSSQLSNLNELSEAASFARLFQARGEEPTLHSINEQGLVNLSTTFDYTLGLWKILFSKQADSVIESTYLQVIGSNQIYVLGCSIAPTLFYSKFYGKINSVFLSSKKNLTGVSGYLKGLPSIVGKTVSNVCYPERSILATANRLFFTVDDFTSFLELKMDNSNSELSVADMFISNQFLFLVIQGEVYFADIARNFKFQKIFFSTGSNDIIGIGGAAICFRNSFLTNEKTWENGIIMAWSSSSLYISNATLDNFLASSKWTGLKLPRDYQVRSLDKCPTPEVTNKAFAQISIEIVYYEIIKAKLVSNPNYVWIFAQTNDTSQSLMLECSFFALEYLSCSELSLEQSFLSDLVDWNFLNSAHTSSILWSRSSLQYTYDEDEVKGRFTQINTIKQVIFDIDLAKWLVITSDNTLYFGSGKTTQLALLRRVDLASASDFTYKFRKVDNSVIRITYSGQSLTIQVYPLYPELYGSFERAGNTSLCDYGKILSNVYELKGNVVNLQSINQKILIDFTLIYPASTPLSFSFKTNFIDLVALSNTTVELSTIEVPGKPIMNIQAFSAVLQGTCTENGPSCNRGIALLEGEVLTGDGATSCFAPFSKVLFVNVSCNSDLQLNVNSDAFLENRMESYQFWSGNLSGCTYAVSSGQFPGIPLTNTRVTVCYYTLDFPYNFYPEIALYENEKFLNVVDDNVEIIEIYNRTGFDFLHINLVLKECYLCSQYIPRSSESSLLLQTAERVCPCKLQSFSSPNVWVSNISLSNIGEPDDVSQHNVVTFRLKPLGDSYCDLIAYLTVLVLPIPAVEVGPWETKIVWIFFSCSIVSLVVSYWFYRQEVLKIKQT